jgi:hypothetical protein
MARVHVVSFRCSVMHVDIVGAHELAAWALLLLVLDQEKLQIRHVSCLENGCLASNADQYGLSCCRTST